MICSNCGKEVPDSSKFCRYCGSPLAREAEIKKERVCPSCGKKGDADQLYCSECGSLMIEQTVTEARNADHAKMPVKSVASQVGATANGIEIKRFQMFSLYKGEVSIGFANSTGTLILCTDQLRFEKKLGNSAKALFSVVGLASSLSEARSSPALAIRFDEMASAHMGKYAGIYDSVVITLHNGDSFTFVPPIPGTNAAREIYDFICLNNGW